MPIPLLAFFFLNITRFFGPSDFLSVFALYYFLFFGTGRWRFFWILLLCASIFVSYSRFVWLEGVFAIILYCFRLSRGHVLALLIGLVVIAPLATLVPAPLIEQRFFSVGAQKSDDIRRRQTDALTQDIDQNFFLGHGFGSFSYGMVRNPQAPYSYEVQWLAIIYQFGVIGLLFILGLLACALGPVLQAPATGGMPLILLFGFSLLSGFANPSLIGRTAGIGFAFVYFCAAIVRDHMGSAGRGNGFFRWEPA